MEEIKVRAYSEVYESEEEEKRSIKELAEGLLLFKKNKEKDKTA
ncbi:hypothetical protein [Hespellia stercorisuis]|uniref:Uncharacterized protein n=1 Tax=Hespellia stercorisuis DSM 15480 TaxID=1121950 RepID=A0A1M6VHD9_9FIRM|nr:hypothetical protein [Hespellia stercorisuis]SHK80676.1 hypothetical protein SAMN02745243_03767 [Hespellia stercorisuis DSM 15480]